MHASVLLGNRRYPLTYGVQLWKITKLLNSTIQIMQQHNFKKFMLM